VRGSLGGAPLLGAGWVPGEAAGLAGGFGLAAQAAKMNALLKAGKPGESTRRSQVVLPAGTGERRQPGSPPLLPAAGGPQRCPAAAPPAVSAAGRTGNGKRRLPAAGTAAAAALLGLGCPGGPEPPHCGGNGSGRAACAWPASLSGADFYLDQGNELVTLS